MTGRLRPLARADVATIEAENRARAKQQATAKKDLFSRNSERDRVTILAIAGRAAAMPDLGGEIQAALNAYPGLPYYAAPVQALTRKHVALDVTAVHLGTPLDLDALLALEGPAFAAELVGIISHLDRRSMTLEGYTPRTLKGR